MDDPESAGGVIVGAIELSTMLGGAFGGLLLDHISVGATFIGGSILLVFASLVVGRGPRIQPSTVESHRTRSDLGSLPDGLRVCCNSAD